MSVPADRRVDQAPVRRPRRILLASYHFPPEASVGGLRIAKFAKILPEFGWESHVLTVKDQLRHEGLDPSRLQGLEEIPIVRTSELPRVLETVARVRAVFTKRLRARRAAAAQSSPVAAPGSGTRPETLERRLTRYAVSMLWGLPDERKNWSLYAAVRAIPLIHQRRIDWVFTSGPPFSVHVIGLISKMFTKARWVADFRDPWIDMLPERPLNTRSAVSDALERWMESAVVRNADKLLTTTERMRGAFLDRYPSVSPDKFVCVPNSIDTDKFQARDVEPYDVLTITYTGSLYFDRTPEPLFHAVSELIKSGRASKGDIRIKLLGYCRYIEGVETREVAARYGLEEMVEIVDQLPYSEAVKIMQRSHVLLLLAPERHKLVVPAKIFDYLGSGSTILALAPPGATSDLMAEIRCGRCFSESDLQGLSEYLAELLRDGTFRNMRNDPNSFSRYSARHLTGRLADEMAEADTGGCDGVMVQT